MKEILKPLVIALSKYIEIVDISFYDSSSDDFIINLEYKNGDKNSRALIFQNNDDNDIHLSLDSSLLESMHIVDFNKRIILDTLAKGLASGFNESLKMDSSSDLLTIMIHNNRFEIYQKKIQSFEEYFKLTSQFLDIKNESDWLGDVQVTSDSDDVMRKLSDINNVKAFLEHVKVNEKDVPKCLIKYK